MQNVAIGYTHYGDVKEPFMSSMLEMAIYEERSTRNIASYISVGGPTITENRNRIVNEFLRQGHEWLLFLDTDLKFEPDLIQKLIHQASPDKRPIIAGLYFGKMGSHEEIVPIWLCQDKDNELSTCRDIGEHLTELTAAGTGCLLIHRSVLFTMRLKTDDPWPWFGHDVFIKADTKKAARLGEDLTFCLRARKAGFPIFGLNYPLSHIKTHHVTMEMYLAQRGNVYASQERPQQISC